MYPSSLPIGLLRAAVPASQPESRHEPSERPREWWLLVDVDVEKCLQLAADWLPESKVVRPAMEKLPEQALKHLPQGMASPR
jgi:hypothetical protein